MLRGRIVERDAALVARALEPLGVEVGRVVVVGDRLADLAGALSALLADAPDVVAVTGGLGPTHDDLTMEAVARATGRPLRLDEEALAMVRARGSVPGSGAGAAERAQRKQATLPEGAEPLPPPGTAPGCLLTHGPTLVVVLPGPPWELEAMLSAALERPAVAAVLARGRPPDERVWRIHGVPEARLAEVLAEAPAALLAPLRIGICARDGELEVTVRAARGASGSADALADRLGAALGPALYRRDGASVDAVIAAALTDRAQTLAVAESCTGGGLGARLTARSGSSAWFLGGVISYADAAKRDLLGVPAEILSRHGAVSRRCAEAMAAGAARALGTDWALSVTGVAGPDGGSSQKPVGLVWIGVAGPFGARAHEHRFRGDRERVRARASVAALHHLREALEATAI